MQFFVQIVLRFLLSREEGKMNKAKKNLEQSIQSLTYVADILFYDQKRLKYSVDVSGYGVIFERLSQLIGMLQLQYSIIEKREFDDSKKK